MPMSRHHLFHWTVGVIVLVAGGIGLGYGAARWGRSDGASSDHRSIGEETPFLAEEPTEQPRAAAGDSPPAAKGVGKRALLIGVTFYENLDKSMHLAGPENDMLLMKDLLTKRYGFPEAGVRILSEHAGKDNLPTRKNIEREFKRLAAEVQSGDQVVILLGGHGSLQPQGDKARFPQPDGCDRIFLPRDVGKWDGGSGEVANAIRGEELGAWLRQIPERKASLFVVVDACHSGSGVRAVDVEKKRQIDPEAKGGLEIPREALARAARRAAERAPGGGERKRGASEASALPLPQLDGVVVHYACQSTETTVEKPMPAGASDARPYGLLTFTLNQILTQAKEPLTYLELAQRVQGQYSGWGRSFPTPLLEGKDQDREVLGLKIHPRRSLIRLVKTDDKQKVTCGALHGLSRGSILAVYPPAGARSDKPLGHVQVTNVDTATSVVEPCKFNGQRANDELPDQGRCEVVSIDYGDMKVKVAVDALDSQGKPVPEATRKRIGGVLSGLAGQKGSILDAVTDPARADWLLRVQKGEVHLVPASGLAAPADGKSLPPLYGPYADDEKLSARLAEGLGSIARVQNLKRLATDAVAELARGSTDEGVKVKLEIRLLKSEKDKEGTPIAWPAPGVKLYDGDWLAFRVHNPNPFPVDVTLLYLDSDCGIYCVYPRKGEYNRVEARKKTVPFVSQIGAKVQALEHMLVIAVKSRNLEQPVNFACLEQPSLEKARDTERKRGGGAALTTPLGRLLEHSLYGNPMAGTRGLVRKEAEESSLTLCSWQVVPGKRR
jgi:hypothetical protein